MKSYQEMIKLESFDDRFEYLKLNGMVGSATFGANRPINQNFYQNDPRWKKVRDEVILRDNGCDLGMPDRQINGKLFVHHINPIKEEDILNNDIGLFDPDNLICVSKNTHDAIHYGNKNTLTKYMAERMPGDTKLW